MSEELKRLEGQYVYLRPTGNNKRRTKEKILKGKVHKVARVYATMTIDGYSSENKYRMRGKHLDNGYNGGYYVYKNLQEVEDELFVEKVSREISNKYKYMRDYCALDRKTITQVAELLSVQVSNISGELKEEYEI